MIGGIALLIVKFRNA